MPKVSIVKCDDYSRSKEAIKKSIDLLGGLENFVKKGDKVLLKPNICEPLPPEKHANTHPEFVRSVIELVKECGGTPIIGELSAGNIPGRTNDSFEISGISKIARETKTKIRNFQEEEFIVKEIPDYLVLEKTDFAKAIFEVDLIINLPKLKTHGITFITGAVKNCFGCIHPEEREYLHREFSDRESFSNGLLDVYSFLKPQLNIMDAIIGMEGDQGPSYGKPRKIGVVLASEDGIALDAVAAKITGHNPKAILTCRIGEERGLGICDIEKIDLVGERIDEVVIHDFKKHTLFNEYRKENGFGSDFIYEPYVVKEECIGCRACEMSCPVNAIKIENHPEFDRDKCIKCFCCQEVCTTGAIKLEKKWMIDIYSPYIRKEDGYVFVDRKSEKKVDFLLVYNINKVDNPEKDKFYLIGFKLKEKDLSLETGKKIIEFLENLRKNDIKFKVSRPLFPCLFGSLWKNFQKDYEIPRNCMECVELFLVEKDGMTRGCFVLKNKLGPKFEYMKDRNQLFEYFHTFLENMKINKRCEGCIHFLRKECEGMCLRG
ncbi:MAG: DUF362 domain-containing protein [Candidatus Aenigmatarchaeota archaeon]